jgi:hypothetical protein
MTATQKRTLDEQIAHEDALIETWTASNDYNSIIDLSDLDDEEGLRYDEDDFEDYEAFSGWSDELYDDGDYSMD